ncbi:hypothetical protein [Alloprevotella tannerae]|uniref:Cbp1 family collagen-binding glycoprotein adhesin n=1 Tax=Alloprevotella tannerae TaxID=76122 RepID=UPI00241C537F|nr:hypothetical protein [Alloprevotella tannerae]
MKKALLVVAAAALLFSCNTKKQKEEAVEATAQQIDSLKNALKEAQNESNDLMGTVEQIQEGFRQINEAENIVTMQAQNGENSNKQAIADNMHLIQDKMKLNRALIANLQDQLRSSTGANSRLKSTLSQMVKKFQAQLEEKTKEIDKLRAQLAEKDIKIAEQGEQITSLNNSVNSLSSSNEQKAQTIAAQDQQLYTAYYVFGTKKELREQRILAHGDVLKSKDFNRDYFTRIDYRVTKTIRLYSKSAQLNTSHPADSYSLERDAQGQYVLRITNPDRFWSVSKYLVITVK